MALSTAPNFSTAGGYVPGQVESTGGGYDPAAAASKLASANSIGGSAAISSIKNIAPSFSTAGGYDPNAIVSTGGGFDPNAITVPAALAGKDIKNPSFISPLANLVSTTSTSIGQTLLEAQGKIPSIGDALSKANLNDKINQLSGAVGSGLNGLTGKLPSLGGLSVGNLTGAAGNLAGAAGGALSSATSAMGGIGKTVQNAVGGVAGAAGGALSSLQSVAGSTSNIAADITGALNKLGGGNIAGGLMSSLGAVSAAAGMINNFLSVKRGTNLPAGGELFAKNQSTLQLTPSAKNDWRVRINCDWKIFNSTLFKPLESTGGVVWPYTPSITVSTKANYTPIDTVHSNYLFQSYKNSVVEDITISGEFSCETEKDAAYWIAATVFFKTATKMFFGQGENAGNPPIVCNLSGYGSSIFEKVPVIIKSFSVDLGSEVNYIRCNSFGTNTMVPVMSTISVTVSPIYNRRNLRKFSLTDFANGKAVGPDGVGYI
jgi:hypothetical protein